MPQRLDQIGSAPSTLTPALMPARPGEICAMTSPAHLRTLALVWLAWSLLIVGYQAFVQARFSPQRPDYALSWTPNETMPDSHADKPYLNEPLLNAHVAWDSEYYLSIAVGGYNDPQMRAIPDDFSWDRPQLALKADQPGWISMNYAFFPLYPLAIRALAAPLALFGLEPIARAALAGVIVSLLGAFAAMLALYDLASDDLGQSGGLRAAAYLLIYPASMFLAQIYTEGLFVGLSFGALALARRQRWVWAALLAACATWTRAAGALLLLPLLWYWWQDGGPSRLLRAFSWGELGRLLLVVSPALAYLLWWALLGGPFHIIEDRYFSRGLLDLGGSWQAWKDAIELLGKTGSPGSAYYLVEFASIGLGLLAGVLLWRRDKALALYSLATLGFALTSGVAQGMHRYALAAPAIFLVPAAWGRHEAFDRVWTIGNVLLFGVFAAMFSFDFWAG